MVDCGAAEIADPEASVKLIVCGECLAQWLTAAARMNAVNWYLACKVGRDNADQLNPERLAPWRKRLDRKKG
jgi:hypothetical protein